MPLRFGCRHGCTVNFSHVRITHWRGSWKVILEQFKDRISNLIFLTVKSGPVLENRMRKIVFPSDAAVGYRSRQWPLQSQNHAQNVHTFFFSSIPPLCQFWSQPHLYLSPLAGGVNSWCHWCGGPWVLSYRSSSSPVHGTWPSVLSLFYSCLACAWAVPPASRREWGSIDCSEEPRSTSLLLWQWDCRYVFFWGTEE